MQRTLVFVTCLVAGVAQSAIADTLHLREGRPLHGFVVERSLTAITFMVDGGPVTVPIQAVHRLVLDASPLAEYLSSAERIASDDHAAWRELALWALRHDLPRQAQLALERAGEFELAAAVNEAVLRAVPSEGRPQSTQQDNPDQSAAQDCCRCEKDKTIADLRKETRFQWAPGPGLDPKTNRPRAIGGTMHAFEAHGIPPFFPLTRQRGGTLGEGLGERLYGFSASGTWGDMMGRLSAQALIDAMHGNSELFARNLARYERAEMARLNTLVAKAEADLAIERATSEREYARLWREELSRARGSRLSDPGWTTYWWSRP